MYTTLSFLDSATATLSNFRLMYLAAEKFPCISGLTKASNVILDFEPRRRHDTLSGWQSCHWLRLASWCKCWTGSPSLRILPLGNKEPTLQFITCTVLHLNPYGWNPSFAGKLCYEDTLMSTNPLCIGILWDLPRTKSTDATRWLWRVVPTKS